LNLLKKPIPIHPFLLAAYPILFLYAQNIDLTAPGDIVAPLLIALCSTLLLYLALYAVVRSAGKAGLLVSALVMLFFSYGHVVDGLEALGLDTADSMLQPSFFFLPIWALLLAVAAFFIFRARGELRTPTSVLNAMAAVLILLSLGGVASYHLGKVSWTGGAGQESAATSSVTAGPAEGQPDIYYIILDAYTSQDVLETTWNYDNSEFVDYLTDKGFYVVPDGHSNYPHTFLSLASTLNMQYLNFLSETLGTDGTDRSIPNQMIQDSEVVRLLKAQGYKFVHFQTGWGPTAQNPNADRDIKCGNVDEFTEVLVRTTMLRPLADRFISYDRREVVLCTFETLAEVQHTVEGPRFVFAHVLVPHPPFLFGPNGEAINTDPALRTKDWSKYYLGQLEFVNMKVEELLERLLSEAETPPIIILQGDHGSKLIHMSGEPSPQMLKERLGILNAYHLPDGGERFLYDAITPVNTFRVLLTAYFGASYEPLEDRSYFSRLKQPYDLLDATDILAQE
jgi:hypothetical protein